MFEMGALQRVSDSHLRFPKISEYCVMMESSKSLNQDQKDLF